MKKTLRSTLLTALSLTVLSTVAFAGTTIVGTKHDLSSTTGLSSAYVSNLGPTGTNQRICVFCHAPHNTKTPNSTINNSTYNYLPLWNHEMTTITTWQGYTTGSDTVGDPADPNNPTRSIALTVDTSGGPGGPSKLCLSCHDGSIAVAAYGQNASDTYLHSPDSTAGGAKMSAGYQIGTSGNLTNHHPIGFNYYTAYNKDLDLAAPSTILSAASGIRIQDVLIGPAGVGGAPATAGGQVECITCHDVHNSKNEANAEKFLWKSDQHSALCLTCHLK